MELERRWSRRRRGERDRKEKGRRWEKEEKVIEGKKEGRDEKREK